MFNRKVLALIGFACLAVPATADNVDHDALRERSLGVLKAQFSAFRNATSVLAKTATSHCAGETSRAAYVGAFRKAWLAWAPLDAYQFGPIVQRGTVLSVGFWPDKKNYVGRGLKPLLTESPEALTDPTTIAKHSAAVQGLPAIERLLYDEASACPAIIGISAFVATTGDTLYHDWFAPGGWAELTRTAGPDNPVYVSHDEFTKVLYTAVDFELTRIADARLGRPLGRFDAPRPRQAEAWRAGLSLSIIDAQLQGIAKLLDQGFAGAILEADRLRLLGEIDRTRDRISTIGASLDKAVSDPMTRIRVEGSQSQVHNLRLQVAEVIGPSLGVETGFSAADGD